MNEQKSRGTYALEYAEEAWKVFPCYTNRDGKCSCGKENCDHQAKHPITAHGLNDATTDPEQIRKWWNRHPDANIAYAPPDNIVVVDVDINHAKQKFGDRTMAELEAQHGRLPPTLTSFTGGGGRQHFFTTDKLWKNGTDVLPGIDIRTAGGYVIVPPSMHISGKEYEWDTSRGDGWDTIAPMPDWLCTALAEGTVKKQDAPPETIPEGSRNDTLFKIAAGLWAKNLSEAAALAALLEENKAKCKPPLPDDEVRAILQSVTKYERGKEAVPFAEFAPFEQSEPLPAFPLDALPDATREFIYYAAEMVQAPLEMVGSCVLGALEIACKGRYPVKLPNGHIERACFYMAPIAPPSERKSGVTDIITRPHIDYEINYNQNHGGEVAQNRSELKLLQGRIANAEQQAIKTKNRDERLIAENELQELNNELAEFEVVEPLRLFGADVTPEKLAAMLKAQGGTFALISAEGGGLFENIGRYSDKGGLEIYLNGYSGDRVCVDRKNSESIVIDRPTLNIIAPCQPSVITDLFSDKQKTGRGLLSRILFIKCQSRVGTRRATGKPLDERIRTNYRNLCHGMLAATSKGELTYDNDGFDVYCSFFDEVEPQLTPDIGGLSFMGDWAGKLPGNMTRLAGLIHCIAAFERGANPLNTQINANEARAAVGLARFYLAHAKAVYSEQAEPESVTNARYLWERIKSLNSLSFRKGELTRKVQNKTEFDYAGALQRLVACGYVRIEHTPSGGGRPIETIIVNPKAVEGSE